MVKIYHAILNFFLSQVIQANKWLNASEMLVNDNVVF